MSMEGGLEIIAQLPGWLRGLLYVLSAGIVSLLVYLWKREQTRRDRMEKAIERRFELLSQEQHGRMDRIEHRVLRLESAWLGNNGD